MATIVDDVTSLQQRHLPWNIPQLVEKIKGFPLKVKSFRNTATYQKLRGGFHTPPPLVPRGLNHVEFLENIVSLSGRLQFEHKATQKELLPTEKNNWNICETNLCLCLFQVCLSLKDFFSVLYWLSVAASRPFLMRRHLLRTNWPGDEASIERFRSLSIYEKLLEPMDAFV